MNEVIGRTLAALLVAVLLPAIFVVFAIVCLVAIVKTLTEKPADPEYWRDGED